MSRRTFTDEQARELAKLNESGVSLSRLARQHGTSHVTIRNTLKRIGVTDHYQGWHDSKKRPFSPSQFEEIISLYRAGESLEFIGRQIGSSGQRVGRALEEAGERKPKQRRPRNGYLTKRSGYLAERVQDDDPMAPMASNHYVPQHRLVVARHLGRPLTKNETVHHINGDKTDNRIENLQLRNGKHGKGVALCCADCGSTNIVETPLA